jgi:hypothetical protein
VAEASAVLDHAARVWAKAQLVWEEPSWEGHPEARAVAEEVAAGSLEWQEALVGLLSSPNQLVVAYALLTLEMMGSLALAELPEELMSRRGSVTFQFGSFRNAMSIGDYAGQLRKRARATPRRVY